MQSGDLQFGELETGTALRPFDGSLAFDWGQNRSCLRDPSDGFSYSLLSSSCRGQLERGTKRLLILVVSLNAKKALSLVEFAYALLD